MCWTPLCASLCILCCQFLSIVHFFIDPSVFSNVHTIYGMILSMILLAFGKHFHDRIMSVRRKKQASTTYIFQAQIITICIAIWYFPKSVFDKNRSVSKFGDIFFYMNIIHIQIYIIHSASTIVWITIKHISQCLRIVVSNTYCVVFWSCFSSSLCILCCQFLSIVHFFIDPSIITRKSSSHETDKIVVSLKHKVLEDTKYLIHTQ
jgi:hypothetical protein